jgi:hypothetical protein
MLNHVNYFRTESRDDGVNLRFKHKNFCFCGDVCQSFYSHDIPAERMYSCPVDSFFSHTTMETMKRESFRQHTSKVPKRLTQVHPATM